MFKLLSRTSLILGATALLLAATALSACGQRVYPHPPENRVHDSMSY